MHFLWNACDFNSWHVSWISVYPYQTLDKFQGEGDNKNTHVTCVKRGVSRFLFVSNLLFGLQTRQFEEEMNLLGRHMSPYRIRSDSQTTGLTYFDNKCASDLYEKEGCEQHEYSVWRHRFTACSVEGHIQVNMSGLSELAREEGDRILIAHMRDIKESAGSNLIIPLHRPIYNIKNHYYWR